MVSLPLTEQSPQHVRFMNSIFDAQRNITFAIGEESYYLQFHDDWAAIHSKLSIQVTGSESGQLWITLSDASLLSGLESWLGDAALDQLPEEIADLVLDSYFSSLLERLGTSVGESFEITTAASKETANELPYALPFLLKNRDDQQTRGMLHFEAEWTPTIKSLISFLPTVADDQIDLMRIPTPIELGRSLLTVQELSQLERFDVVIINQTDFLAEEQVTLTFHDAIQLDCVINNEKLVVHDITAQTPGSPQTPLGSPSDVNELQLPMVFQVGLVQPTVGELQRLSPGDELDVCRPTRKTIDLVVAGQSFGTGELIQCGDRLGVRILSFDSQQENLLDRINPEIGTATADEQGMNHVGQAP